MTELVGKVSLARSVPRRDTIAGHRDVAVPADIILTGIGGVTVTVPPPPGSGCSADYDAIARFRLASGPYHGRQEMSSQREVAVMAAQACTRPGSPPRFPSA